MSDEFWQRLWQVFHGALERPEAERQAFIDSACGDDRVLRREVEQLLRSHAQAGAYLEGSPPLDLAPSDLSPEAMIGELIDQRYRVLAVIGEGGMGVVYRGEQEQPIRRAVAIKLIKPGMDSARVLARFKAERQAMAELEHPNIARIYDAGATPSGRPYFVMEYIPGVPITEYCDTHRCGTRARLELFLQVCDAVHYAHQRGIVHRDLKPSNVLVQVRESHVAPKVIDFGVAKAVGHGLDQKTALTVQGQVIGTPAYMSPEQAQLAARDVPSGRESGDESGPIDARSDIYSLGILLYELLVGQAPFGTDARFPHALQQIGAGRRDTTVVPPSRRLSQLGRVSEALAARRGTDAPSLQQQLRGDLDRIVMQAMERDRRRRFGSVSEFIAALHRSLSQQPVLVGSATRLFRALATPPQRAAAIAGVAMLALGLLVAHRWLVSLGDPSERMQDRQQASQQVRLAVLPFRNLGGDPSRDYFSDGLTEEMIARLGSLAPQQLGVIARTTIMQYKGTDKSIQEIGKELGVDYVLEGSVRADADRARITTQLVRVSDQMQMWSETYEPKRQDILGTQIEVSLRVARSFALEVLRNAGDKGKQPPVVAPLAYDAYLRGRYFRDTISEEGLRKSIESFKEAIAHDTEFAPAYAGLAVCYCLLSGQGLETDPPKDLMTTTKIMAERALALDDNLAQAHGALAMYKLKYAWDWRGAEASLKKALELDANDPMIHIWFSFYLSSQGRHDEALAHVRIARDLDRFSRTANLNVGLQHYEARNYDAAVREFNTMQELFPGFWGVHWGRGLAYSQQGNQDKALRDLRLAVDLSNGNHVALGALGYAYGKFGERKNAQAILDTLQSRSVHEYVPPVTIMTIFAALGDSDAAFIWLEKAYQVRSRSLVWIKVGHEFDPLREDPRYKGVLFRMGLDG